MTQLEKIERLYNIKLRRYIKNGVEISDELDDVLYREAINEVMLMSYVNERGKLNGNKVRRQKDI